MSYLGFGLDLFPWRQVARAQSRRLCPTLISPPHCARLTAELFYVREGQINFYALNFVVPVPATIGELHFTKVRDA
ncbi:hypothetical protein MSG28_010797 [Choristoneura fumiferana]|uniref:Uncharacterized protein n=1 Tax=Choristoneura fumiferana TaxID=7141 RepID=A0ACC0KNM6_CHOFU|nr:hypothetical protein MSG28_010797 [Choristoneura fumiferana]